MAFWVLSSTGLFSREKLPNLLSIMFGEGRRKFAILVALEFLIWHFLELFQRYSQQNKQN